MIRGSCFLVYKCNLKASIVTLICISESEEKTQLVRQVRPSLSKISILLPVLVLPNRLFISSPFQSSCGPTGKCNQFRLPLRVISTCYSKQNDSLTNFICNLLCLFRNSSGDGALIVLFSPNCLFLFQDYLYPVTTFIHDDEQLRFKQYPYPNSASFTT